MSLGKKCTYGHKCKFYHPERGSQPQRAVADELRASAKMSSVASKGLLEHTSLVKSHSADQSKGISEAEPNRGPAKPSKQSPTISFSDLLEDRLRVHSKVEGRRGSNSSSSSCGSSIVGYPAPGGPPSMGRLDRWEHSGGRSGGSSKTESYHRCESPEVGYSSLVKTYSSLSLIVPQSPECFSPADLRAGSLPSDCSSEGSVSSESFSPDPMLDDIPKCNHHHHHYSGQYTHIMSHGSPGPGQHSPYGYTAPQALRRQHRGFDVEDPPPSVLSHASPLTYKTPSVYLQHQHQHPLLSSFPGELSSHPPHPPQISTPHPQPQSSSPRRSLWQEGGLQDPRVYEGSPLHPRRNYSNQQLQHQINWDPKYQPPLQPCYDPFSYRSLPQVHGKTWHSPWSQQVQSSPRGLTASSPPPFSQPSLPPISAHKTQLPPAPQHQDPPALGRYQDLRERVFVNLCSIFPPDLVRLVMARHPHVMDAQELAAAILMEKLQHNTTV